MAARKNKSLGKKLPDILNEQETLSIVKSITKMNVTKGFPGIGNPPPPTGFDNSTFIYADLRPSIERYFSDEETPDERAKRLNNELQGCF
jgi:hypothetical protein